MAKITTDDQRRAAQRAEEFKRFRKTYLYSQTFLAQSLNVSRRTIVAVERAEVLRPHPGMLRRFVHLRRQEERAALMAGEAA